MSPLEDADILQDSASVQMDEAADMSPIRDDDKLPDSAEKVANEEGKKSGRCDSCKSRKKRCDGSHEACAKNTQPGSGRNGKVPAVPRRVDARESEHLKPLGRRERTESYDRATELVRACAHMCAHTRMSMCTHTNRPQHSLACPLACARTDSTREGCSSRKL